MVRLCHLVGQSGSPLVDILGPRAGGLLYLGDKLFHGRSSPKVDYQFRMYVAEFVPNWLLQHLRFVFFHKTYEARCLEDYFVDLELVFLK